MDRGQSTFTLLVHQPLRHNALNREQQTSTTSAQPTWKTKSTSLLRGEDSYITSITNVTAPPTARAWKTWELLPKTRQEQTLFQDFPGSCVSLRHVMAFDCQRAPKLRATPQPSPVCHSDAAMRRGWGSELGQDPIRGVITPQRLHQ